MKPSDVFGGQLFRDVRIWLDDGDAKHPLEFKYVKQLTLLLSSVGSWPHKVFGRTRLHLFLSMYNLFLIFVAIAISSAAGAYIYANRETITFDVLGHVILCILLESLFLQRLCTGRTTKYHLIVKEFLQKFHLFYFKHRTEYAAQMYKKIQLISILFTIFVTCHILSGVSLFTLMPVYNNYRAGMFGPNRPENSTFEHSLYFYCFTDKVYTTPEGYWMLLAFNIPTSFNTSSGILTFDLLLSLMVFQILGHLKIMKNNLANIESPDGDMFSPEENARVKQALVDIIEHHNLIIKFVDKCSDTFSEYLFVFYMLMQFLTIVVMVELTAFTTEAVAKYGPLTVAIYQPLIQISILFEMISTHSEKLIDAIYDIPWQYMDTGNRKTTMFLLMRSQNPVTLKAGGMVPVGVTTMTAVLKTTFSYYMVLNAARGRQ